MDLARELSSWCHDKRLGSEISVVDILKHSDGESSCFSGSGLSLSDGVSSLDNRKDSLLLNFRWVYETVTEDTTKKVLLQI